MRWRGEPLPLLWRVFTVNAAVLAAAAVALVVSPLTVSFPVALTELVVLAIGLAVLLVVNLALLRRIFGPLARLTRFMREVDPLRPGSRLPPGDADPEIAELTAAFNDMVDRLEGERRDSALRALAAQERERRRIALELHDEVGQALTAAMLRLDRADVEEAREGLREAVEEIREIARRLRPEALDDLGLSNALRALVATASRSAQLDVTPEIEASLPPLSPEQELVLYRVAQEALTNAVRHADASALRFSLASGDGEVVLSIEDDGCGFDLEHSAEGEGIRGMRERALLVRAGLEVHTAPGRGTAIRLRMPA
ncbi:MAG: HAMP domain-containing sensor histidine kinase [Thermoleophilaceae bacterium]